jgi:hypothetical protein
MEEINITFEAIISIATIVFVIAIIMKPWVIKWIN